MTIHRRFAALIILSLLMWTPARADTDPNKVVAAIKRIAQTFQSYSDSGVWLLRPCTAQELQGSWAAFRYEIVSLTYDVKKTDSLINPIVGLLKIEMYTYTNSAGPQAEVYYKYGRSGGRGGNVCYRSPETALSRITPVDIEKNPNLLTLTATYRVDGNNMVLASQNEIFANVFRDILTVQKEPNASFASVVEKQLLR